MEIETIPSKEKVVFSQDEVRQTRDIGSKLNGMSQQLNMLVNGTDKSVGDIVSTIKELVEMKRDVDKFFEQIIEQVNSLK